jgi:hypothetical protein
VGTGRPNEKGKEAVSGNNEMLPLSETAIIIWTVALETAIIGE